MKAGAVIGCMCGFTGLGVGLFFGVSPVISDLQSGLITASEAGQAFGFFGAATGMVFAFWGITYEHMRQST